MGRDPGTWDSLGMRGECCSQRAPRGMLGPARDTLPSARGGEGIHHQARAPARDVGDDRGAPMQLGHCAQVDRECEADLLALAQTQTSSADENAGGAQVHGFAKATLTVRKKYVDSRARSMPRVQSSFHPGPPSFQTI